MKFILFISIFFNSCTIFLPEVYVATERTAAEKQLIGNFSSTDQLGGKSTNLQLYIKKFEEDSLSARDDSLQIYSNIKFLIYDDIVSLKDSAYVGESLSGELEFLNVEFVNSKRDKLVSTENRVRSYIIKHYADKSNIGLHAAKKELYYFNIYTLSENQYYQDEDGKWVKKVLK